MALDEWKRRLNEKRFLVSDGAWGTELAKRGLQAGETPEKWNLDRPDDVRAVAASYMEAGSDIILTNTFGGNVFKLAKVGLEGQARDINRRGVAISKEAASGKALVFASVGPTGEFMEPVGTITEKEMAACFAQQVQAIAEGGADGIVVETMTDLGEAKAALRAAKESSRLPVVVSMTFTKGLKGFATMMGVRPEQAAAELAKAGADMVGANCSSGIEDMVAVARLMKEATALPLWIKPNAGLPELVDGKTVFRETPEMMAKHVPALVEAGARIIGGCCGTTPGHIRLLAKARKEGGRSC
jgi:5-methyltetrahydrofolate--homocysteine methyltransferase